MGARPRLERLLVEPDDAGLLFDALQTLQRVAEPARGDGPSSMREQAGQDMAVDLIRRRRL